MKAAKICIITIAAIYGITCALDPADYGFMDNVDLVFHEAGHVIFRVFGSELMMILGGSLMQLIVPGVAAWALYASGQRFSSCVVGVWLSQSFFNVSVYAKDAWKMQLPILGGDNVYHDWNYIIVELDLIGREQTVGNLLYAAGALALAASAAAGAYYAWKTGVGESRERR